MAKQTAATLKVPPFFLTSQQNFSFIKPNPFFLHDAHQSKQFKTTTYFINIESRALIYNYPLLQLHFSNNNPPFASCTQTQVSQTTENTTIIHLARHPGYVYYLARHIDTPRVVLQH
eukprot:jgi/Mesvir1/29693/Mv25414-RA.1